MAQKPPACKSLFPDFPTEPADAAVPQDDVSPLTKGDNHAVQDNLPPDDSGPAGMYDRLVSKRTLLPTLERFARQLRASHQDWKERLLRAKPGGSDSQIASEALELALRQLGLSSASPAEEDDPFPLEDAMAFLRRHTPPA